MSLAAVAAAAVLAEKSTREENEMTPYMPQDVAEHWEFKILRSAAGQFRDPVWLRAILEDEARAGWTMIEKFDDFRVRLKRPASAHAFDATLEFDPYRTSVGISWTRLVLWIALAVFGGSLALVVLTILAAVTISRYFGAGH